MFKKVTLVAAGIAVAATAVFAGGHTGPFASEISARKSHMQLYQHNLGILGNMAKGAVDYDADTAGAAAANLATLTKMSQRTYWPAGSDSANNGNTRALPDIWENFGDVAAIGGSLADAAGAMETAAGTSLEALQAAMGPVGGACGACHKKYRASE